MKTKALFALVCATCLICSSCGNKKSDAEDTTKFSTESIVGIWVCVGEKDSVAMYYDIKSNKHLLCMEKNENDQEPAIYNPEDGYLHVSKGVGWTQFGDLAYVFDEERQIIRCTSGTFYSMITVKDLAAELGSDEVFQVKRIGLDEAWLYSKIKDKLLYDFIHFTLHDEHVYRIKGIKEDLE